MDALLVATAFGLGLLFFYDALVRPEVRVDPLRRVRNLGPTSLAGTAGAAVALLATGWPVAAIAGAALAAATPRGIVRRRKERAHMEQREAIAEISGRLRDAIRSGVGLADALGQAASNAPAALAQDLRRLVAEAQVSGLGQAARSFARRVEDPSAELFAAALDLADRLGSRNLTEVLDSLAEATTAQVSTIREARARQTRARMSARIVAAVPMLLLLAIRRANPAYLAPFGTPGGQAVLAFAFLLIWTGYVAMKRAARIEGSMG